MLGLLFVCCRNITPDGIAARIFEALLQHGPTLGDFRTEAGNRELPDDAAQFSYVWLTTADNAPASLHSLSNQLPQQQNKIGLLLRQRDGIYSVGPNGFFFAEGTDAVYKAARYGQFKVDSSGKALLTGLLDENLQLLGENAR
jgi:hypothetical protein